MKIIKSIKLNRKRIYEILKVYGHEKKKQEEKTTQVYEIQTLMLNVCQ